MARREQTGGGAARRGRSSGGRSTARGGRRQRSGRGKRTAPHSAQALSQASAHAAVGERPTAGSVWHASAAVGGAEPLLTLATGQARGAVALTLVGAEQAALRDALHTWGAARDLAANRAWRRPGGLVRMAGL